MELKEKTKRIYKKPEKAKDVDMNSNTILDDTTMMNWFMGESKPYRSGVNSIKTFAGSGKINGKRY